MPLLGSEEAGIGSIPTAAGPDSPGITPPVVAPTLAAVYAAGLGAPIVDNLMGMANGTSLRFQANTDASNLPVIGLYETVAGQADDASGLPSFGQSLATKLATLIGGRVFNWYQMFDPAWNGTFAALDSYSWVVETGNFLNSSETSWVRSDTYFERSFEAVKNYVPPMWPVGSTTFGTMWQLQKLYNTVTGGMLEVAQLDGFGTMARLISSIDHGVVFHDSIRVNGLTSAGDGAGRAVYLHASNLNPIGNPPDGQDVWTYNAGATAGIFKLRTRNTGSPAQAFDVATFEQAAITFNAPVNASASNVVCAYATAELDLTVINTVGSFGMPSVAGKTFVPIAGRLQVTQQNGTITTTCQVSYAQGGTAFGATLGPNTSAVLTLPYNSTATLSLTESVDTSISSLQAKITTAAVLGTSTVFKGKIVVIGFWL
jgi:hypothetical protein